jgi:SnoaL-like protein
MNHPQSSVSDVQSIVTRVTHDIDFKRWPELRALYASEVETDYTSLFGGTPVKQSGDVLIDGWRRALGPVTTHHLLGPIDVQIDGPRAQASCQVRALHHVPGAPSGEHWEVLGHYTFALVQVDGGWKITKLTLATLLQTGNHQLLAEAAQRAQPASGYGLGECSG